MLEIRGYATNIVLFDDFIRECFIVVHLMVALGERLRYVFLVVVKLFKKIPLEVSSSCSIFLLPP